VLWSALFVSLSVRTHISRTTRPNFTEFFVLVACDHGLNFLWRHCNTLCTSGFVDDCFSSIMGPMLAKCYGSSSLQCVRLNGTPLMCGIASGPSRCREALLLQRDCARYLSVEILQLQNISLENPVVWHYLRDTTFSRFDTIPECDKHRRTDTWRRHTTLSIASRGKNRPYCTAHQL